MSIPHEKIILWPLEPRNLDTITLGGDDDR